MSARHQVLTRSIRLSAAESELQAAYSAAVEAIDIAIAKATAQMSPEELRTSEYMPRRPRALQAIYLRPLRRRAEYGVPACDLQLRSYHVRNVEFFADFALRAAYYLGLPASGPVPLPRLTERWTVPRSSFIYKKSQENFERLTFRRLIQIQDAHTDVVERWLAFLRQHAYHGVGMKANVWQFEGLGVGEAMEADLEELKGSMGTEWASFGRRKTKETLEKATELMGDEKFQKELDMLKDE